LSNNHVFNNFSKYFFDAGLKGNPFHVINPVNKDFYKHKINIKQVVNWEI